VKALEKKYLRKKKRESYPEFVVYLITNEDLLRRRTYIVGCATSLKNRLSTYNKTCEHSVVYFSECRGKDLMKVFESVILSKLSGYRESPNRDRFVLPADMKEVNFLDKFKEAERFLL
jgi:hypothetical protein